MDGQQKQCMGTSGLEYLIVCSSNKHVLDANVTAAKQFSKTHQRVWLNPEINLCSTSQIWRIMQVDEEEGTKRPAFVLAPNVLLLGGNKGTNDGSPQVYILDGNTARHIPQMATKYPAPFLWPMKSTSRNHQWFLEPVIERPNTFVLLNRNNSKCLDGNVGICAHPDPNKKSPFLSSFDPKSDMTLHPPAIHQCWELIPYPRHLMHCHPFLENGVYTIETQVKDSAGGTVKYLAINDTQVGAMGLELVEHQDERTRWQVTLIDENQYLIERYTGYPSCESLLLTRDDETEAKLNIKFGDLSQISNLDRRFLWQLFKSAENNNANNKMENSVDLVSQSFHVLNVSNGHCLDGDECKISITGFPLPPPTLSKFDYRKQKSSQVWQFHKITDL